MLRDELGEARHPPILELAALTRLRRGGKRRIGGQRDPRPLLRFGLIGIGAGEKLAHHRRVIVLRVGPKQIGQAGAGGVEHLGLGSGRRVSQGEAEILDRLGTQPRP